MVNEDSSKRWEITEAQPVTANNRALYEAGKTILVESVETGRKFCETMIGVATGAVAGFVALLGIVTPKDHLMTVVEGTRAEVAGALFLLAALCFVIGYLPMRVGAALDSPEIIEAVRAAAIRRRHTWGLIGFVLFILGVAIAAFAAFRMIGTRA